MIERGHWGMACVAAVWSGMAGDPWSRGEHSSTSARCPVHVNSYIKPLHKSRNPALAPSTSAQGYIP